MLKETEGKTQNIDTLRVITRQRQYKTLKTVVFRTKDRQAQTTQNTKQIDIKGIKIT